MRTRRLTAFRISFAAPRQKAEAIAFQEPWTKAGHRTMKLVPRQRSEGDMTIRISFANGTMTID